MNQLSLPNHFTVDYYYGSFIHCNEHWKAFNICCPFSKFYYIIDGECEITINQTVYQGIPGRMFYIKANTPHSFCHRNNHFITKYWIHFNLTMAEDQTAAIPVLPCYQDIKDGHAIISCFEEIYRCSSLTTLAGSIMLKAKIIELFSLYAALSHTNTAFADQPLSDDFSNLLDYINENIAKNLTVFELAELIHLHPNYFIKLFKKKMHVSPYQYITRLRIEKAKALLENTNLPVIEIMKEAGFHDLSEFSNFFKHNTNLSPTQFRKLYSKITQIT